MVTRDVFQLELDKRNVVKAEVNAITGGIELTAGGEVIEVGGGAPPVSKTIKVIFDGDSKSLEPGFALSWVDAKTPIHFLSAGALGVGGTGTGVTANGLTSTARLAAMAAMVQSVTTDGSYVDLYLTTGTNDTATLTSDVILENVKTYVNAFFVAGGRYLVLMSVDPKTSTGYEKVAGVNAAYAAYARTTNNVIYCDTTSAMLDFASAINAPIGGSTNARLAVTHDGLHANGCGIYRKATPLTEIALKLYRQREPQALFKADLYNLTTTPSGNLMGTNGRFTALGGTVGTTNGTVTGTPPLGWTVGGNLNGMTVAFTAVSSVGAKDALGAQSDIPVVRMTLSGTPSANTTIDVISAYTDHSNMPAGNVEQEVLLYANNLVGLFKLRGSSIAQADGSLGTSDYRPSDEIPELTQMISLYTPGKTTAPPPPFFAYIRPTFRSGVAVSGSVDLIGFSLRRTPD